MTVAADRIRNRRRAFAAPGGFHDRLIAFLAKAMPAAIGLIVAVLILAPLSPRGEISFLLDRTEVAITDARLEVDEAIYRGQDANGRLFTVTAGNAIQTTTEAPIVDMTELAARMTLSNGPAELWAPKGVYNYRTDMVFVHGPVNFRAADGYRMVISNVAINLATRRAVGSGGVAGAVPTGTFSAQNIVADLDERTISLEGNARLRMTPGELRLPQ